MSQPDPIDAVIFDLGGVLVHWDPAHLYRELIPDPQERDEFLSTICNLEWNAHQDRGRTLAEGTAQLVADHPGHKELIEAYYGRWEEMVIGPIDASVALLGEVRSAGVRIYALSNWSAETFPNVRHRFSFLDWFEDIVISGEVGLVKPETEIYELAIKRFGLDPAATLFIDDSPANIEAALASGFVVHHFHSASGLEAEFDRLSLRGRDS